jgi:hypothetical protein
LHPHIQKKQFVTSVLHPLSVDNGRQVKAVQLAALAKINHPFSEYAYYNMAGNICTLPKRS